MPITRRQLVEHLRQKFNLTRSKAERITAAAMDVHRTRPAVDPLGWAEADATRRLAFPVLLEPLRGPDPTGDEATRRADAGVTP